jgi:tetratricopeptide (TPR) repeat protein
MAACGWAAFYLQQDIETSFSLFQEIAAALKIIHGPGHPAYLTSLSAVAWSFVCQGRDKEGVDTFGELQVPKLKEILGSRNPTTLSCEYGLGVALCNVGESAAGAKILESTLAQQRSLFADSHTATMMLTMNGLAWAYVGLRRLEEAQALYEEASEQQIALLGADHIETMSSTSGKAWLLFLRSSPEAALRIFEDVMVRQARLLGIHHSDTHDSVWGLEKVYKQLGQKSKARELRSLHTSCGWSERKVMLAGE